MIGYLKPYLPELKVKELDFYKALYCGFCQEQHRQNDIMTRLLFPSDIIFIYLLFLEAIESVDFSLARKFCAWSPIGLHLIYRDKKYLPLFAEIQRTLAAFKLLDFSYDTQRKNKKSEISRFIAKSMLKKNRRMQIYIKKEQIALFDAFFDKEQQLICNDYDSTAFYRQVSETIVSFLPIEYLANNAKGHVEIILHNIIKIIYILDALDDYSEDSKKNEFNIISFMNKKNNCSEINDSGILEQLEREVNIACNLALEHYNLLPYHHNRGLMENFFCFALPLQYKKLAAKHHKEPL